MNGACRVAGSVAVTAALVVAGGGVTAAAAQAAKRPGGLSEKAATQIAALQGIKQSQSKAEQKLDSRLVVTLRRQRDRQATAAAPQLDTGVAVSKGATEVDVRVKAVSKDLLDRLEKAGAHVRAVSKSGSIRASLPLASLERVAAYSDVLKVQVAAGAITARMTGRPGISRPVESKEARAKRVERQLTAALADVEQGSVVSEGDKTHAADVARARHRVTGVGVKICALSDGVDSLEVSQAAGELPDVDVLPGQGGGPGEDEGTAMLELIHDLAPNAELGFATAFISDASFAENIRKLRFDADCDVIVDDVLYFNESPFQDGPIAQSVNAVTADGALYFSSAGNQGNALDGTSGNYESDFVDSGLQAGKLVARRTTSIREPAFRSGSRFRRRRARRCP